MSLHEQSETIALDPRPGFVVKTKIVDAPDVQLIARKVFINICHESKVPRPQIDFEPEKVFPLIIDNQWEIPMIVLVQKEENDKKGFPLFVLDCCINSVCFQWCQVNADLRSILIEWSIECVEILHGYVLERQYTIPKMMSKGQLSQTEVPVSELTASALQEKWNKLKSNETLGLIEALNDPMDIDEGEVDNKPLPNLMNISGTPNAQKQKILIEEIPEKHIKSVSKIEEIVETKPTSKLQVSKKSEIPIEPTRYEFNVTYTPFPENHDSQLLVKFHSEQISSGSDLDVFYVPSIHSIRIVNLLAKHYFTKGLKEDYVDLPLAEEVIVDTKVKSAIVIEDNTLYILM